MQAAKETEIEGNGMKDVHSPVVMSMMLSLAGASHAPLPKIAQGIADAANQDPLFPKEVTGAEITACLLVAYAFIQSRFDTFGGGPKAIGLYRLRLPVSPRVSQETVTDPKSASLVLIDLVRTSAGVCKAKAANESLAWVLNLGSQRGPADMTTRRIKNTSWIMSRIIWGVAKELHRRYFSVRLEKEETTCAT